MVFLHSSERIPTQQTYSEVKESTIESLMPVELEEAIMTIVRRFPLRDLAAMQNVVDRMFYDALRGAAPAEVEAQTLAVDVYETPTGYDLSANVAGVDSDTIQVRLEDTTLTILVEVPQTALPAEGARALLLERPTGRFSRRIQLPQPVDFDHVEASYDRGVLHLSLPKRPEAQPKTITVKSLSNQPSAN